MQSYYILESVTSNIKYITTFYNLVKTDDDVVWR